jgi:DNA modification methylase
MYSERMKKLQSDPEKYYKPMLRPSGHDVGKGFANDNGGSIPSNLLQISNTESNSQYMQLCRSVGSVVHPARFPEKLPAFFINFLTEPKDVVLDIFAGSNTTGRAAETAGRRWLAFEKNQQFLAASAFRFLDECKREGEALALYDSLLNQKTPIHLNSHAQQRLQIFEDVPNTAYQLK